MHSGLLAAVTGCGIVGALFPVSGGADDAANPSRPFVSEFSGHAVPAQEAPWTPAEAARSFRVPEDLEFEQVLAEPIVRQPVFLNFDERGRMWVVQYLQYPAPAGLRPLSRDVFWRAVYDKVPEPPPRGEKGLDKITIHEDTDGDGRFDRHRTFVEGLNIATACAQGRGGVWVLNPPYLLFYPDRDRDDVPDGEPVVHLEGFGLEDTHSVVNSLRWGPDGWLYAAQGSTVTAKVRRPGEANHVYSQGQHIWRYHPESRRYEVFAEGGGNAFGVEIDPAGRIFSGHNGGDTRGFHYQQGAYLRKGFEKHGELSNPYAFGYFPHMEGTPGERFTHNFILYHGGALPERYRGRLFGVEPLQGRVVLSEITAVGSTFKTRDLERVVTSRDAWFRPVDIKLGPDGAIYVCDWYDRQVTHTRNQEGHIHKDSGRIYRLRAKGAGALPPFDLARRSTEELVTLLGHTNQWFRDAALRVLGDRRDAHLVGRLRTVIRETPARISLPEWLAFHQSTDDSETEARLLLDHPDAQVRLWAVRILGDRTGGVSSQMAAALQRLARTEPDVEVRAQLASTARRLPTAQGLPLVAALAGRDEDAKDPRLPLLCWWAIECRCETEATAVVKLFEDSPFWTEPLVEAHLIERLMRRFAATGRRRDLLVCARLLELAPSDVHVRKLMLGFEEAFKGRSMVGLPDELTAALARHGLDSPLLRLRRGDAEAIREALRLAANAAEAEETRRQIIEVLAEMKVAGAGPVLLDILRQREAPESVQRAALGALAAYDNAEAGAYVAGRMADLPPTVRPAAITMLTRRESWMVLLLEQIERGTLARAAVPREAFLQMLAARDEALRARVRKLWGNDAMREAAEAEAEIKRLTQLVRAGSGDPYEGRKIFMERCGGCHRLFQQGGRVGPDLTAYRRDDLETLLFHILRPSAEIREGYEGVVVETKDGRLLTGFVAERDPRRLVVRGLDGLDVPLDPAEIVEMKAAGLSLMPEGLLEGLTEPALRNLLAYLGSSQPLAR